jgi:hypothetical protein
MPLIVDLHIVSLRYRSCAQMSLFHVIIQFIVALSLGLNVHAQTYTGMTKNR